MSRDEEIVPVGAQLTDLDGRFFATLEQRHQLRTAFPFFLKSLDHVTSALFEFRHRHLQALFCAFLYLQLTHCVHSLLRCILRLRLQFLDAFLREKPLLHGVVSWQRCAR